ncbi:FAD-dependent oxidoreductase [Brevibacillus humidisoli]|uniref:phytoene desaturase family protein n=1 Tax=Brevibacillus humidisoli TaxID=2895522 RepID=UPI001E33FEF5|nr:FAD-dependent oxidoreductase [Brevibacillus humidisoli]
MTTTPARWEGKPWDTVVIGGGLAGLTAATWLARRGKQVLLLERSDHLGGRAMTEEREGCLFNLGPHALYKQGAGMNVLCELGVIPKGGTAGISGKLVMGERVYEMPLSPVSLLTSKLFSWREKKELIRLISRLPRVDTDAIQGISLHDWVEQQFQSESVKQLFYAISRLATYTNEPELTSAAAAIRQVKLSAKGALYLHGGWQQLVDGLLSQAVAAGATVHQKRQVTAIGGTAPEMIVTTADGHAFHTRSVISTLPPPGTVKLLRQEVPSRLAALGEAMIPVKGACLDIACKRLPRPDTSFALDLDRSLYFSNHSAAARLSRDRQHAVVHLFKYLRTGEEQDAAGHRQEMESFLDQLQPGWRREVLTSRYLPAITVSHRLPRVEPTSVTAEASSVADIPGLYLAGDWLTAEGLLADAALSSGRQAASCVLTLLTI